VKQEIYSREEVMHIGMSGLLLSKRWLEGDQECRSHQCQAQTFVIHCLLGDPPLLFTWTHLLCPVSAQEKVVFNATNTTTCCTIFCSRSYAMTSIM